MWFCVYVYAVIGEPFSLEWYNPQGELMVPSSRVALHNEGVRSRLTLYNANIEDAGIYRCQATDSQGQTREATVVLEIYREFKQTHTAYSKNEASTHAHVLYVTMRL